jgi:NAD(P)H dehydrogenase (quinone)
VLKLHQQTLIATSNKLENYNSIIFGVPTRYGRLPSQMVSFLDQNGSMWVRGALCDKVDGGFTSTAASMAGTTRARPRSHRNLRS